MMMERETKYCGKRSDNGELVTGSLINNIYKKAGTDEYIPFIFTTEKCDKCLIDCDCNEHFFTCEDAFVEVNPSTIGQYTGKNDKNDTEIYEKHKVKVQYPNTYHPSIVGEVVFEEGCWMIKEDNGECWLLYSIILGPIEIIE